MRALELFVAIVSPAAGGHGWLSQLCIRMAVVSYNLNHEAIAGWMACKSVAMVNYRKPW